MGLISVKDAFGKNTHRGTVKRGKFMIRGEKGRVLDKRGSTKQNGDKSTEDDLEEW